VLLLLLLLLPIDVLHAPVYPELDAEHGVEDEREEEARGAEGVADLDLAEPLKTANALSWPMECARMFWRIWGSLLKGVSGRVVSWRRPRTSLGTRQRATAPAARPTAAKAMVWDLGIPVDARERGGVGE
jgi:hypothetical protein